MQCFAILEVARKEHLVASEVLGDSVERKSVFSRTKLIQCLLIRSVIAAFLSSCQVISPSTDSMAKCEVLRKDLSCIVL